jgi:hypothetical protein
MSLTDAIREAYADPTVDDNPLATLELDHPTFDQPVRIIANALEDMTLGLENGQQLLFQACPVSVVLDGVDDDGPTSGQIVISNVSGKLQPYLKEAVKAGVALTIKFRGYTMGNLLAPGEVRGGLLLSNVSLNVATATGTLEPATKADRQAFPRVIYSLDSYPALHGQG